MGDIDPQMNLFSTIGFVVVHWALVEHNIDIILPLIFHKYGGNSLRKEIPKTRLNQKVSFLRDSFNKIHDLSKYKQEGLILINIIEHLSDDRHRIIHGSIIHSTPDELFYVKLQHKLKIEGPELYQFTLTNLRDYGNKVQDLSKKFSLLVRQIINDFALSKFPQLKF